MIEVEALTEATLPAAAQLITDLRRLMNGRVVCTAADMLPAAHASLARDDYAGFIALYNGAPAGYMGINARFAIYSNGPFGQITELIVDEAHHRHGIGHALITHARTYAAAQDWPALELGAPTQAAHPATYAFYMAQGFKDIGPRMRLEL